MNFIPNFKVAFIKLVTQLSLRLPGLQPTRLLCSQGSPVKNSGVGCHFLLQRIFPTQVLKLHLLCLLSAGRFFSTVAFIKQFSYHSKNVYTCSPLIVPQLRFGLLLLYELGEWSGHFLITEWLIVKDNIQSWNWGSLLRSEGESIKKKTQ